MMKVGIDDYIFFAKLTIVSLLCLTMVLCTTDSLIYYSSVQHVSNITPLTYNRAISVVINLML
jgi:hypothetical protein